MKNLMGINTITNVGNVFNKNIIFIKNEKQYELTSIVYCCLRSIVMFTS